MNRKSRRTLRSGRAEPIMLLPPNMQNAVPFDANDFAKLDAWLAEEGWPADRMDVAMLEGYLVALLAWPIELPRCLASLRLGNTRLESGRKDRDSRTICHFRRTDHRLLSGIGAPADRVANRAYVRSGRQRALLVGAVFCRRGLGDGLYDGAASEFDRIGFALCGCCGRRRGHCALRVAAIHRLG